MKIKNMSNSKKLTLLSGVGIGIAVILYSVCNILGYDSKIKLYILIGIGLGLVISIVSTIVKLKRDGAIYDERDGHIEKKANAIAFDIFKIILLLIVLLTYNVQNSNINIGGYTFLLLMVLWIIRGITYFFVKLKN